jgi:quercetin dioxygenase-like cupin family protein
MQAKNIVENAQFASEKSAKVQVVKTPQLSVDGLFLKSTQSHGPARLPEADRVVVCVSGAGELVLHTEPVDQRIELTPGSVALVPKGTWHAVIASKGQDLIATTASPFPVRIEERG